MNDLISNKYKGTMSPEAQRFIEQLTPDQQAIAETLATLRVENRMFKEQVRRLSEDHKELFKVMLVILAELRETTGEPLRIQDSQFLRLEESWRIDRSYDLGTGEVVLELKTIRD